MDDDGRFRLCTLLRILPCCADTVVKSVPVAPAACAGPAITLQECANAIRRQASSLVAERDSVAVKYGQRRRRPAPCPGPPKRLPSCSNARSCIRNSGILSTLLPGSRWGKPWLTRAEVECGCENKPRPGKRAAARHRTCRGKGALGQATAAFAYPFAKNSSLISKPWRM